MNLTPLVRRNFFLGMLLLLILSLFLLFRFFYQQQAQSFQAQLVVIQQNLQSELSQIPSTLVSLNQLYLQGDSNDPFFLNIASQLIQNKKFISVLGVAPYFYQDNLAKLEQQFISQGFETLKIRAFDERLTHEKRIAPILYLEPFTPFNARLLGKDLFTLPELHQQYQALIASKFSQNSGVTYETKEKKLYFYKLIQASEQANISFGLVFVQLDLLELIKEGIPFSQFHAQAFYHDDPVLSLNQAGITSLLSFSDRLTLPDTPLTIQVEAPFHLNSWQKIQGAVFLLAILILYWLVFQFVMEKRQHHQQLEDNEKRYNQLISNAHEGIMVFNDKGVLTHFNRTVEDIFHLTAEEIKGRLIHAFFNDPSAEAQALLIDMVMQKVPFQSTSFETKIRASNGVEKLCYINHIQMLVNEKKEAFLFIEDITERRLNENKIQQLAYYDELTGLESRHFFKENLNASMSGHSERPFQLLFIDLDGFKKINDSMGHNIGDQLLEVIANRFRQIYAANLEQTHLCRFGGDEFVIAQLGADQTEAIQKSHEILEKLQQPILIQNHELMISASIGLVSYPKDGRTVDSLLSRADAAMYEAKASGKNTYTLYDHVIEDKLSANLEIEHRLRLAIKQGTFQLHYQPKVELATGTVNGVEALLRWTDDVLGAVPPSIFIKVAEETGHILALGDWVVEEAVRQLRAWKGTALESVSIAINVSSHQLQSPHFLQKLLGECQAANISTSQLELELTESVVMDHAKENISLFHSLRQHGFQLSIDDFGTGYSSLSYLKRFPVTVLKLDKSFVDGLPDDSEDRVLCQTIVQMAKLLGLKVVAEGVEEEAQRNYLAELECDLIQGYFYAKPMPSAVFDLWFVENILKESS